MYSYDRISRSDLSGRGVSSKTTTANATLAGLRLLYLSARIIAIAIARLVDVRTNRRQPAVYMTDVILFTHVADGYAELYQLSYVAKFTINNTTWIRRTFLTVGSHDYRVLTQLSWRVTLVAPPGDVSSQSDERKLTGGSAFIVSNPWYFVHVHW